MGARIPFVPAVGGQESGILNIKAESSTSIPQRLNKKLTEVVSVKDFGAKGDGSTDDTDAIQRAVDWLESRFSGTVAQQNTFNCGILFFPFGRYMISDVILISSPGIIIKGAGMYVSKVQHTSNTGCFRFRHDDYLDGQNINNCGITDIDLIGGASTSAAGDVALKVYVGRFFTLANVKFTNFTVMVDLFACEEPVYIVNCVFWHDKVALTGTSSVRMFALEVNNGTTNAFVDPDDGADYFSNSMVFMDNCDFRALAGTATQHIFVEGIDGLYASNCHFLNATSQLSFDPISAAVGIGNVMFDTCFFDGSASATNRNVYVQNKTFTSDMSAFNLAFNNCKFNGADVENIRLDHEDLVEFRVTGGLVDLCPGNYMVNAQFGNRLLSFTGVNFRLGGGGPDFGAFLLDAENATFFDLVSIQSCIFNHNGGTGGEPARYIQIESDGSNSPDIRIKNNEYRYYSGLTSKFVDDNSSPALSIVQKNNTPFDGENDLQTLTGAGAVDVINKTTHIVTTGTDALTLADGFEGQEKFLVMKTYGGVGTLTPTNLGNGTTITFNTVGQCAHLYFTNGAWYFMGGNATLA